MLTVLRFISLCFIFVSFIPSSYAVFVEFQENGKAAEFQYPASELQDMMQQQEKSFESIVPGYEEYMQNIVDNLDSLKVVQGEGKISLDMVLMPSYLRFDFQKKNQAEKGELYAVRLSQKIHLDVSAQLDEVQVENIQGVKLFVKMPWLPDGIYPQGFSINARTQILNAHVSILGGLLDVFAKADIKTHTFEGVDWGQTVRKNIPALLKMIFFSLFIAIPVV